MVKVINVDDGMEIMADFTGFKEKYCRLRDVFWHKSHAHHCSSGADSSNNVRLQSSRMLHGNRKCTKSEIGD